MMETASLYFDNKNNNTNDKSYKIISRKNSFNMKRKDKVKLLAQATEMGDEDLVAALLKKKKALVNTPNHVGRYPLHSAAQLGNLKIAQLLIDAGADINAIESTSKWTVLHFAALSKNKDMFYMLLSQTNIAVAEKGNREGNTALHYYARNFPDNYKDTIEQLLQKGALIDAQNLNGETPLHNACWKGHVAIVRTLIDNRANINSLNDHGETPLHWAARMGYIDIVKVLLEAGANPNVHGTTGTPLEVTPVTETSIRDLLQRAIQALQPQQQVPVQSPIKREVLDMPLSIKRKASPFQWEIAYNEMKLTAKIGEGSFSDVYLGTWRGIEVAVKMLKNALSAESFEAFLQEITLVSKLRHPNVVLFLGACLDGPAVCYVTEYIPGGNLFELLKKESVLGWPKKTGIAIEIARGMQYLHAHKILHGDLKSLNLLVDENFHIKVADFGLSKIIEDTPAEDAEPNSGGARRKYKGTLTWQGPEVVNESSEYTEKSDVYSFGIVLWELVSHRAPYEGLDAITVLRYIDQGQLPEMPPNLPAEYLQLIHDCCARNPADRPDFDQILERLKALRSKLISLLPADSDPNSSGQSPWTV